MSVQINKDVTTIVVEVPKSNVAVENAVTEITVQTSTPQITISSVGINGKDGITQDLSSLNDFTASYYIDSASIVSLIQQATNEQDLSNYAIISGGNAFIGNQTITGSFLVSGSTTQIGNNTLLGNTLLGGNIGITGTSTLSGSFLVSGSTTQIGNNTLIGLTTLTGSIFIAGDFIPQISSSFTLGTLESPWKDIFIQSGSIIIRSDIPGAAPAKISNKIGDIVIESAGFALASGSVIPFEVTQQGQIQIKTGYVNPNNISALTIIGNNEGNYVPPLNPGGMLHIVGHDGLTSRINNDSYGKGASVWSQYIGRHASGSAGNPLPTEAGILLRLAGVGFTQRDQFGAPGATPDAMIDLYATQNFTNDSNPTEIRFSTTPSGSITAGVAAVLDNSKLNVTGTLTASLTQGYMWVGDSNNKTKLVPTASLVSDTNLIDGGAAASIFILSTEVLNGGGA